MTESIEQLIVDWHWTALVGVMVLSILALGKGADWLIEEAVALSLKSGLPRVVVGATVVSVGTTMPEAAVSVLAAFKGQPGLALGNAVGSIICDTGLILGLACIWKPLPIDRRLVNRQGWVQFGCGLLLVGLALPWSHPANAFTKGGVLPQLGGFALLVLLGVYMMWSVRLARMATYQEQEEEAEATADRGHSLAVSLVRLLVAVAIVLVSCSFLISTAKELAERWHVPEGVIAATMVAFGTSLPELIIVLTATAKNQGELAIGNVIGADILNVLFVAGAAAAATPQGLAADKHFFQIFFPGMLFILFVFRVGIWQADDDKLKRRFGVVLVLIYLVVNVLSYLITGKAGH